MFTITRSMKWQRTATTTTTSKNKACKKSWRKSWLNISPSKMNKLLKWIIRPSIKNLNMCKSNKLKNLWCHKNLKFKLNLYCVSCLSMKCKSSKLPPSKSLSNSFHNPKSPTHPKLQTAS